MKTIKNVAAACVLSLLLAISVPAGDMPGPAAKPDPKSTSKTDVPVTCEQIADSDGQISSATPCDEATPNLIDEAMIIAIEFLISIY